MGRKNCINKIIPFKNLDKSFQESWKPGDNLLNFPHSTKILFFSAPGRGKTSTILNCIFQQKPAFDKIYILHPDDESREYDVLGRDNFEFLKEIPEINFSNKNEKSLLIIDDIDFTSLSKSEKARLDRLSGYTATHRNLSIYLTTQNFTNIFPSMRRNCEIFFIWSHHDRTSLNQIGMKTGFKNNELVNLLDTMCKSKYDNICIDTTGDSPAPLRLNGFTPIKK